MVYKKALSLSLIGLLLLPSGVSAQTFEGVTPTVYCLGSCPTEPTATTIPTPSVIIETPVSSPISGTVAPTTSLPNTSPPASPSPTVDPCAQESQDSIMGGGHKKKYKKKFKKRGGFIEQFLRFIFFLIELFLKGLLGQPPANPGTPSPSVSVDPTAALSPSPTEEVTPEPTVDPCATPTDSPADPPIDLSPTQLPTGSVISPTIGTVAECTNPAWFSADPNGMWDINGYFIHNNMWNASIYPDTEQTTYACGYNSWYVTSTASDTGDGAVKTYPNVHKDYNRVPLSSFTSLTSTYAHVAPNVGNWNFAYDIWINGIGNGNGTIELMIWTEAKGKQASAVKTYPKIGTATLSGNTYAVYKDNNYIVFEMTPYKNAGTLDLKEIFDYALSQNLIPANATLHQVDYGVEVVSTDGAPETFKFTDFSVTAN